MKIQQFSLSDDQGMTIKVLLPVPKNGDPWGDFAPLRGTFWEGQIPVIPGDVFSVARHGYLMPLWRLLGPDTKGLFRQVPEEVRPCADRKTCPMAEAKCYPNPKMPLCYRSPEAAPIQHMVTMVLLAWQEGRYVLVVDGPEFVN